MTLTKQDIDVLFEAVERWEILDVTAVITQVLGSPGAFTNRDEAAAFYDSKSIELKTKIEEASRSRKEKSVLLRAKLLAMRDAIVVEQFCR